jgi:hypothetical protein
MAATDNCKQSNSVKSAIASEEIWITFGIFLLQGEKSGSLVQFPTLLFVTEH